MEMTDERYCLVTFCYMKERAKSTFVPSLMTVAGMSVVLYQRDLPLMQWSDTASLSVNDSFHQAGYKPCHCHEMEM